MSSNITRLAARNPQSHNLQVSKPQTNDEGAHTRPLRARAKAAADVAARHADAVDRDARFPSEAFAAIREQKLLGLLIPEALGGEGARPGDVADVCAILGAACASSAMIFAMHQTKVACLTRHSRGVAWQENLQRRIAADQLLMASSTTEGSNGGNIRSSEAAVRATGSRISLERIAACISYCEHADGIVTTARRDESAAGSDQVLAAFLKEDYSLQRTQSWDTLGMRGTCSVGVILRAAGEADQVLADPYERIHAETMTPFAHMFWSAAWAGLAAGAVRRARNFVRVAARASGGKMPPAAAHLTHARVGLETLRGVVQSAIRTFERRACEANGLDGFDMQTSVNLLKVEASELAVSVVMSAMRACGLSGYRNDTEFTLGRHLRDVLSSPIMINNDRILANAEATVLMSEVPTALNF
jgi:acyl-CoA dehydrogenase